MIENISLIAHSAVKINCNNGKNIYFDPFELGKNYIGKAEYIFVTHSHYDHFSPEDILKIKTSETKIIAPKDLENNIKELGFDDENILLVMPNENYIIDGIEFNTIPAYNINKDFHKKEYNWVGYIVNIDGKKIYIAGDTDNTEEAQNVNCDIACVPVGGTYTMTAEEAADLIKKIKPEIAIPIHYGSIVGTVEDAYNFKELLDGFVKVEILKN